MIKQPDEKTREAIMRIRHVPEFESVLWWLRNLSLYNHHRLPSLRGEDTLIGQGEVATLDALYKHLTGSEVFDGAA